MGARTVEQGYGWIAKSLHWVVVALVALQLGVGYAMDAERADVDCDPVGERRSGGDTSDAEEERLDREEERCEAAQDAVKDEPDLDDPAVRLHVGLGVCILVLAVARVVRRRLDGLPAWAPELSGRARKVASVTEKCLLVLLFAMPLSGLVLVLGGDVVELHVATHLAFLAALAVHLATNLRPRVLARML